MRAVVTDLTIESCSIFHLKGAECTNCPLTACNAGSSSASSLLKDVALMCTQRVITNFKDQEQYLTPFATMIFPLLLVRREVSFSLSLLQMILYSPSSAHQFWIVRCKYCCVV